MRLNVEFLNGGRSSYSRPTAVKKRDSGLFWWMIIITLTLGAAIASWFFTIYVFAYPEKPFNYRFLSRMHKLEPLKKYTAADVPQAKALGPRDAFDKFNSLSDSQLKTKSELFRRSYITNYRDEEEKPVYVKGDFKIYQVRPLTSTDVFTSGLVVRAQAIEQIDGAPVEYPNTIIEFIFPTEGPAKASFNVGDILTIDQKSVFAKDKDAAAGGRRSYATVLNVERLPDQKMLFTLLPLLYGVYEINREKDLKITLEPPQKLNIEGRWPVTDEAVGAAADPVQNPPPKVAASGADDHGP